jgi:hypothetical protein
MSLAYLSTPYTHYRGGIEVAHAEACILTARLLTHGVMVYSPIAHSHSICMAGKLDHLDLELWYKHNELFMDRCDTLIVAHMTGWQRSDGMTHEVNYFLYLDKPIYDLNVQTLSMKRRIGFPVAAE